MTETGVSRPPAAPGPSEIFRRAVDEGDRRLSMSLLGLVSTGFNAGLTIVLGIVALGVLHALVEPRLGPELARVAGAAGFAIGLVCLTTSRSELFTENFFDPVAAAVSRPDRRAAVAQLLRLWSVVLGLNLVGGAVLVLVVSIDGVLPAGAEEALARTAEHSLAKSTTAALANAVVGGVLVTLLSFLLQASNDVLSRMVVSFLVGFLLAVGPFAHVVVTFQHLLAGSLAGADIPTVEILTETAIAVVGNLVGGLVFVTLTHVEQARGERSTRDGA